MNGAKSKVKKAKVSKIYVCICKVGNNPDGTAKCIKHRLNDLLSYVRFLDQYHPTWTWFNVYSNTGANKGQQLASYTKHNRPVGKKIAL